MLAKIDDSKITLIKPLFSKSIELPTGFSDEYLSFGFLYLIKEKDYQMAVIHFVMSLLTAGLYWIYFANIGNNNRIRKMLSEGCTPSSKEDIFILKNLNLVPFDYSDDAYVRISNYGSSEQGVGAAKHLRDRSLK